jgi:hypothetical protein
MLGGFAQFRTRAPVPALSPGRRNRTDLGLPAKIDVCENCDTRVATVTDEPNFGASMNNPEKK